MATHADVARYKLGKKLGRVIPPPEGIQQNLSPLGKYNLQKSQQAAVDEAMVSPSFGGSEPIEVGGLRWGAPPGSSVLTLDGGNVVWVMEGHTGAVHTLTTRDGKVVEFIGTPLMQAALESQLRAMFERKRKRTRRKR